DLSQHHLLGPLHQLAGASLRSRVIEQSRASSPVRRSARRESVSPGRRRILRPVLDPAAERQFAASALPRPAREGLPVRAAGYIAQERGAQAGTAAAEPADRTVRAVPSHQYGAQYSELEDRQQARPQCGFLSA